MSATSERAKLPRGAVVIGAILAALLLAAVIAICALIATMNAQAYETEYRACMESFGVGPGGTVTDVEQMAEAAEWCSSR